MILDFFFIDSDGYYSRGMPSIVLVYSYDLVHVFILTLDAWYVFIVLCTVDHF